MRRDRKLRAGASALWRTGAPRLRWRTGALVAIALTLLAAPFAYAVILDTYVEDFDSRTADATINSVDLWSVTAGSAANALVESSVTATGGGKALQLAGASTPVTAGRSTTYGGLTPSWVRFLIRPGVGNETRTAPTSGVAAVTFDAGGKVLASDGTSWVDTGVTYATDSWWEVIYKLNFSAKTYDLYIGPAATPATSFVPVKTGLNFIDSSKSSLGGLSFSGAYSATNPSTDDTYLDSLRVDYIERVGITTAAQTLVQSQPSGPITVQLWSTQLEAQRAPADISLEMTSSSAGGRFSLSKDQWVDISQVTILKDATTATFYYKDSAVGKPTITIRPFPDQGWMEAWQQQQVIATVAHFEVSATSPQTAGTPFTMTITAKTEDGAVDESYGGTVGLSALYVSPATGTKIVTPTDAGGFAKGKRELTVIYPDAGTVQIVATDLSDSSKTGKSGQILVVPATLAVTADTAQVVGQAFPLTITAQATGGTVTPNYQGPVTLSIQAVSPASGAGPAEQRGAGSLTPASVGAAGFQNGKATADVSYPRWGTITITAADGTVSTVTGTSPAIIYHPAAVRVAVAAPPSPRDFYYTQETFNVAVTPLAAGGATIPNYQGAISVSASSALGLPQTYTFVAADAGVHTFTTSSGSAGTFTVEAHDAAAGVTSDAASVTVKQAILTVVSTLAPVGGATEVKILLTDDKGKVITSESSLALNVKLSEANPNGTVSSSALTQPIQIINGKATFLIANTESETVTVLPTSPYGIAVRSGIVSFGRYATKGVGILLWREIKEEPKVP